MPSYTATQFLLDHINISETVKALYHHTDTQSWSLFPTIIAPSLLLDYTALFGTEPRKIDAQGLVDTWKPLMEKMSSTHHVMIPIKVYLPQPGIVEEVVEEVMKVKVDANVIVHLIREGMEGGEANSSGGVMELELLKIKEGDEGWIESGNPWRISVIRAKTVSWMEGNKKVFD